MVAASQAKLSKRTSVEAEPMWYAPDRRLTTPEARDRAIEVAEATRQYNGRDLSESELFIALHTAAYYATGGNGEFQLPEDEQDEWAGRWHDIREYIVEANLGLVYTTLGRFRSQAIDDDQLLSESLLALTHAVRRFNPWKGYKFSTYACNCIARACIRRNKRDYDHQQRYGVSYDGTFDRPEPGADEEKELRIERIQRVLAENSGDLTDLEQRVLQERFPMNDREQLTFRDIGKSVGLSKERVRQIQNSALQKLRDVLEEDPNLQ